MKVGGVWRGGESRVKETGAFWKEQLALCEVRLPSPNKNKSSELEGICKQESARNIVKSNGGNSLETDGVFSCDSEKSPSLSFSPPLLTP